MGVDTATLISARAPGLLMLALGYVAGTNQDSSLRAFTVRPTARLDVLQEG